MLVFIISMLHVIIPITLSQDKHDIYSVYTSTNANC